MSDEERLERLLLQNLLPFWGTGILDRQGGYRLNHDVRGRWLGPAPKALVTQTRTLWFFSRLLRSRYGTSEHAQFARHGFAFLEQHMRDANYGGFYWEVCADGSAPTNDAKNLYGQAFALYALSEFGETLNDAPALAMAHELFELLEQNAHDNAYGGYIELFDRPWKTIAMPAKTFNTHLHLLEGITRYFIATRDDKARHRIDELLLIIGSAVVRKSIRACSDAHLRDWTPLLDRRHAFTSYGHDIESGWLMVRACEAIGVSPQPLVDLFRSFADYGLKYGFDTRRGGFYHMGRFNKRASDRSKVWWVQAESMLGLLVLWKLTGDQTYRDAASRTLKWIYDRQADWKYGEWHARIDARGRPGGNKTGPWKGPYHSGRALLESLAILRS